MTSLFEVISSQFMQAGVVKDKFSPTMATQRSQNETASCFWRIFIYVQPAAFHSVFENISLVTQSESNL